MERQLLLLEREHQAGSQISVFAHAGICPSAASGPLQGHPRRCLGVALMTHVLCQQELHRYLETVDVKRFDEFGIFLPYHKKFP